MKKLLVFDMDGTIADFYGVDGWLQYLKEEKVFPYRVANAMYDMSEMRKTLLNLKSKGWKVVVTTWLSMHSSEEFEKEVTEVKKQWLDKFNFPYDEFNAVSYGTPKHEVTNADVQILFDDNDEVRQEWKATKQIAINANENILDVLKAMEV